MKKQIGYALIALSFLVTSLIAVQEVLEVNWTFFVPVLIVGWIGVAVVRAGSHEEATAEHAVAANIEAVNRSLAKVVDDVSMLNAQKAEINTYDMRHKIDELCVEDLNTFADARMAIAHRYGLNAYADVMTHFAAGERYLNRVWSASADGYIDEVNKTIVRAEEEFKEAKALLGRLSGSA